MKGKAGGCLSLIFQKRHEYESKLLMKIKFLILLLIFLLISCEPMREVVTKKYHGVVFSAKDGHKFFEPYFDTNYVQIDISDNDINIAEDQFEKFIKDYKPNIYAKLTNYKRQYLSFKFKSETILLINFIMAPPGLDWKKRYIMACDGGDNFFTVKVNITTGKCFDLRIQGHA